MINKVYKLYLDFGTGYTEIVNEYNLSGAFTLANDINPAIYRLQNNLTLLLTGENYVSVKALITNTIDIPFKIEALDDSGAYNVLNEGTCDIRVSDNVEFQELTIKTFNISDSYKKIQNDSTTSYSIDGLGLGIFTIKLKDTTAKLYNTAVCTSDSLTPTQYKTNFDVDGFQLGVGETDDRWQYYTFESYSTSGCPDGQQKYNFSTDSSPIEYPGASKIEFRGIFYWVSVGIIGENIDFEYTITETAKQLSGVIHELIRTVDNSYSFNSSGITYSGVDVDKLFVVLKSWIINNTRSNTRITLAEMLDFMANEFALFWYMDGNSLKFKHSTELVKIGGGIDLSNIDKGKQSFTYIAQIPVIERFTQPETDTAEFLINEIRYETGTTDIQDSNLIFSQDFIYFWNNYDLVDNNGMLLMDTSIDGSDRIINIGTGVYSGDKVYNNTLAPAYLIDNHLNDYRPFKTGKVNGVTTTFNSVIGKPMKSQTITARYYDLNDIDTGKYVTTSLGNGTISSVSNDADPKKAGETTFIINFEE